MGPAGWALSSRLHAYRFSLLCCARLHSIRLRVPSSPAPSWLQIRNPSLSSRTVQHFFCAGLIINHDQELHTQAQVAAECSPRDNFPRLPEFWSLLESLVAAGYSNVTTKSCILEDVVPNFPVDLLDPASVCLAFARHRPTLLGFLPRSDIEVVVQNGTPNCFKDGDESKRRMISYIRTGSSSELDMDRATMIDLMKYILSYISNFASPCDKGCGDTELVESSLKNLLHEIAKLSYGECSSSHSGSIENLFVNEHKKPISSAEKIEMKRGDWICPSCNFMNFARNVKCLECEKARPKSQLRNGEWECPQCDFFNYGKNTMCFRCECKRPNDISLSSIKLPSGSVSSDMNRSDRGHILAANEEKTQRWFRKVSEMNSSFDVSSAMVDEDFPDIMPLRKGVNTFAGSILKKPFRQKLANSGQQQSNSVNDTIKERISRNLDKIFDNSLSASASNGPMAYSVQSPTRNLNKLGDFLRYEKMNEANGPLMGSHTMNREPMWGNKGGRGEFISNSCSSIDEEHQKRRSQGNSDQHLSENSFSPRTNYGDSWSTDGARIAVNSLRRCNDNRGDDHILNGEDRRTAINVAGTVRNPTTDPIRPQIDETIAVTHSFASQSAVGSQWKPRYLHQENARSQHTIDPEANHCRSWNNGYSHYETATTNTNKVEGPLQSSAVPNTDVSWRGRILECSGVQDSDALDMSEEAKAERWFKRVADIKDISDLSKIPDEDFPSIMPMRKGINRFVVSKRKTPLERRLTSQQYRRNLPTVTSESLENGE